MALWMLTSLSRGRVAIRIRHAGDRARRVVLDEALPEVWEEWRCSRCGRWFPSETISLVESGRAVAGTPEVTTYCGLCSEAQSHTRVGL
jgi:hypothetical protein